MKIIITSYKHNYFCLAIDCNFAHNNNFFFYFKINYDFYFYSSNCILKLYKTLVKKLISSEPLELISRRFYFKF